MPAEEESGKTRMGRATLPLGYVRLEYAAGRPGNAADIRGWLAAAWVIAMSSGSAWVLGHLAQAKGFAFEAAILAVVGGIPIAAQIVVLTRPSRWAVYLVCFCCSAWIYVLLLGVFAVVLGQLAPNEDMRFTEGEALAILVGITISVLLTAMAAREQTRMLPRSREETDVPGC